MVEWSFKALDMALTPFTRLMDVNSLLQIVIFVTCKWLLYLMIN